MAKDLYKDVGYKCKNCGSYLRSTGHLLSDYLVCPKCFSNYYKRELDREINKQLDDIEKTIDQMPNWERSFLTNGWKAQEKDVKALSCPSCGAKLLCDGSTAALPDCPYCGNHAVITSRLEGTLKPDYLLPFKLSRQQAENKLREYFNKWPMKPEAFLEGLDYEELRGVYVPYWMFEGKAEAKQYYYCRKFCENPEDAPGQSRNEYYHVYRTGLMEFDRIVVDASEKLDDDYMQAVRPYDLTELKPFSSLYLSGYTAERFDSNMPDMVLEIEGEYEDAIRKEMLNTISEYLEKELKDEHIDIVDGKVSYVMLPVWLFRTQWEGEKWLYAVNGQTGEVVGSVPYCRKKKHRLYAALGIPMTALAIAFSVLMMKLFGSAVNGIFFYALLAAFFPVYLICERVVNNMTMPKGLFRKAIESKGNQFTLLEKEDDLDRFINSDGPK